MSRPALRCRPAVLVMLVTVGTAAPAAAHPHVFVDTDVHVRVAATGLLEQIDITWRHDLFFSMLLLTELGLDPVDPPEAEAIPALTALVPDWIRDYGGAGVIEGRQGERAMGSPHDARASLEDGRIVMRLSHRLDPPMDLGSAGPLTLWFYDPLAFVAYLVEAVTADAPPRCGIHLQPFEADVLTAELQDKLAALGREEVVDEPGVGRLLADRVVLRCD